MARPFKDDDFLCERCWYILNGLGPEADCPECGKPAWESHPGNRVGTAWQRGASIGSMAVCWVRAIFTPRRLMRHSTSDATRSNQLGICSLLLMAVVMIVFYWIMVLRLMFNMSANISNSHLLGVAIWSAVIPAAVCAMGCLVVRVHTEVLSNSPGERNGRMTPQVARVICGHASVVLSVGTLVVWGIHVALGINMPVLRVPLPIGSGTIQPNVFRYITPFLAGWAWYYVVVRIGVRSLRYINPPEVSPSWPHERGRWSQDRVD